MSVHHMKYSLLCQHMSERRGVSSVTLIARHPVVVMKLNRKVCLAATGDGARLSLT